MRLPGFTAAGSLNGSDRTYTVIETAGISNHARPEFTAGASLYKVNERAGRLQDSGGRLPAQSITPAQITVNGVFRGCFCRITRQFDCELTGGNGLFTGQWSAYECTNQFPNLCGSCVALLTNR